MIKAEKGFSLIEMIVASAILLFSISIIMNTFITGSIVGKRTSKTAIATNLARKKLELVKNKAYTNIVDEPETIVSSEYNEFTWSVNTSYIQKNGDGTYGEISSDNGLKKIVVKVSWSDEGKSEVEVSGIIANANLYENQGAIAGYVYEADGSTPVEGANVATGDGLYSDITASDGSYSIDNILSGTYSFYASKSGYAISAPREVTVTAGSVDSGVNFTITNNPGAISGILYHSGTTQTISGANLITSPGGYQVTSDDGGGYTIASILPGDYTVTATASGYRYGRLYGITVIGGSTTNDVNFELNPKEAEDTGTFIGTIFSEDGSEVGGALIGTNPGEYSAISNNNVSDPAFGTYTISNVIPGSYSISASASGYVETELASKTINENETIVVDITLKQIGGTVRGLVTNQKGKGVEGVRLSLSNSVLYALTDNNGYYQIPGVPVGTYNLTASMTSPPKSQTVSIEVYSGLDTVQDFNTKNFN